MTAYNKVNGVYAGRNTLLIQDVLKGSWGYPGWVMSDWGGTASWEFALAGLDQESGAQIDAMLWQTEWFTEPLQNAYAEGRFPKERLSEMVQRILRSMYAVGIEKRGEAPPLDMARHNEVALEGARQGIVLLKNDGALPLSAETKAKIVVIGGHAQIGVPAGTGSSAVEPPGGFAEVIHVGGPGFMGVTRNLYLSPSPPLEELKKVLPSAQIDFDPGISPAESALAARRSDIAIVFGIRLEGEGFDNADISLPWGQDSVIEAVADANPNTVVVLETGNPVAMPWLGKVRAVVEAWFPGQAGGQAIAEVLAGEVNPSGRLPVTFPVDLSQTPRPVLEALGAAFGAPTTIDYHEGAEVGYRWFARTGAKPLFAFGHGLGYTSFGYADLEVTGDETVMATLTVTNTGARHGADVPQLYLTDAAGEKRMRLLGFDRVELGAGESRRVTIVADPRLLARYDSGARRWHVTGGVYLLGLGKAADDIVQTAAVTLPERHFGC